MGTLTPPNVTYRLELVGIDVEDGEEYVSDPIATSLMSDPINLTDKEQVTQFTFVLPEQIPDGRLALLVQPYINENIPAAYEYAEITITGERNQFVGVGALVVVNGEEYYEILDGPTVGKEEEVTLDTLVVGGDESVMLQPVLSVFAGTHRNGALIATQKLDQISLGAEEEIETTYTLPVASLEPGVYTALLSYNDENGKAAAIPLEIRYIIDGLKPKIASVFTNTSALETVSTFDVTVMYVDVPFNIRVNEDGTSKDPRAAALLQNTDLENSDELDAFADAATKLALQDMTALVVVTDAQTQKVLGEKTVAFGDLYETVASFKTFTNIEQIVVDVTLMQAEEVLDTYSIVMNVTSSTENSLLATIKDILNVYGMLIGFGLLTLIVVISLIVLVIRKNNNQTV